MGQELGKERVVVEQGWIVVLGVMVMAISVTLDIVEQAGQFCPRSQWL